MPGCAKHLDEIDPAIMVDAPESVRLWLPSTFSTSCDTLCTPGLPLIEFRLRYAEAVDSLNLLRRLLRLVRGLSLQNQKHPSPTQRATRSQSVFEGMAARIAQVSARYRDTRTALRRLHPSGGWVPFLQELKKDDIQGPSPEGDNSSQSRFIPSWIWTLRAPSDPPDFPAFGSPLPNAPPNQTAPSSTPNLTAATLVDDAELTEGEIESYVLIDWAKAQERAKRYEEEVELCTEEMRRTLLFFLWSATEWERRAEHRASSGKRPPNDVFQGLRAYSLRRSAMYREMVKVFVSDWSASLKPKGLGLGWLAQYSSLITIKRGWNRVPSIIPIQPDAEPEDAVLSDLDEALEQMEGIFVEQDAEAELHDSFVQIIAEE